MGRARSGTVGPVPWSTAEPGLIETVVAVLLSRENPRAQRVRPSQGDGGLDVIVPAGDVGVWDDHQVKCFASNLSDSQKGQIEWSLLRAAATHADPDSGIAIRSWLLTLPLDATREQLAWLRDLAAAHAVPFECEWRRRAFLDGLAARHPDVIDYYFRDGRDRLEGSIALLRSITDLGAPAEPGMLLAPAEATSRLSGLFRALNRDGPTSCTSLPSPPRRPSRQPDRAWSRASPAARERTNTLRSTSSPGTTPRPRTGPCRSGSGLTPLRWTRTHAGLESPA